MRIRPLATGAVGFAAIAALSAAPAAAIKHGEPANGERPEVGLMISYATDAETGELTAQSRCSGTQMDEDTYLTAGHCTYGAEAVAMWYGDNLEDVTTEQFRLFEDAKVNADAYSTNAISHPEYNDGQFYTHDVGVVELAEPVDLEAYGTLPEAGYWDEQLAAKKKDRDAYATVGYGLQRSLPDKGGAAALIEDDWIKEISHGELIGDRNFGGVHAGSSVVLTNNANTGGTCSGDSGGPTFIDETSTVVTVTSFGVNTTCVGTSGMYRIDQPDDLAFLGQFID